MSEYYSCKLDSLNQLIFFPSDKARWLNIEKDFEMIESFYNLFGVHDTSQEWFNEKEWKICALIDNNEILSFAGALYMTERNWEIGAVKTHPQYRNKGYARIVCSFVAKYIIENGKQATCNTQTDNYSMQKVMKQIGMVIQ